jgi:hypothetical protein
LIQAGLFPQGLDSKADFCLKIFLHCFDCRGILSVFTTPYKETTYMEQAIKWQAQPDSRRSCEDFKGEI